MMALSDEDAEDFLLRNVTRDETWCPHFDPDLKEESKQWKHPCPGSSRSWNWKGKWWWQSSGMLTAFLWFDFLDPGWMINGDHYTSMLEPVQVAVTQKHHRKLMWGVCLLQDNAPAHKGQVAMTKAANCGSELLFYLLYSPDLAPLNYHLLPTWKSTFTAAPSRIMRTPNMLYLMFWKGFPLHFFLEGIAAICKRFEKYVGRKGDYVENK